MTAPADPAGLREQVIAAVKASRTVVQIMDDGYPAALQGSNEEVADAVLAVLQHDLESLEQQAGNAVVIAQSLRAEVDRLTADRAQQARVQQALEAVNGQCRRAEAERDQLRTKLGRLADVAAAARSAAGLLRDAAERTEQHRPVNAGALRSAAGAIDDIVKETT